MKPFDQHYWDQQYSDLKTIDGIGNVKDHSRYLAAFFNLEGFEVESLIDFGFGYGHLLKEMARVLKPRRIEGIEPSPPAFKKVHLKGAKLYQEDLVTWSQNETRKPWVYDLGICNSVFQYLSDQELKIVLPILSQRVRYLYLTVPTDIEYERQKSELNFEDPWSKARTRSKYHRLLKPHFTFISTRILESKHFYNDNNTPFQDLLFRH